MSMYGLERSPQEIEMAAKAIMEEAPGSYQYYWPSCMRWLILLVNWQDLESWRRGASGRACEG